jgi:hypothetical protein
MGRQRRKSICGSSLFQVVGTVCLFVLPVSSYGQFDLSMIPHIAEMKLKRGQRADIKYELTNENTERELTIKVFAKNMMQGSQGEYTVTDSQMPHSCVSWLSVPDTLIRIAPGEMVKFPVKVNVPPRAQGGAYGAIIFEIVPDKPVGPKGQPGLYSVDYTFQLPGWIEISVESGRAARGRLTTGELTVVPTKEIPEIMQKYGDGGLVVTSQIENIGDVHVFTKGRMIIRDENNRLIRDTRLGSGRGAVLPGAKSILKTITKLPPPGKYSIKTIIDYGGRSPAIAQANFEISEEFRSKVGKTGVAEPLSLEIRPERLEQSVPAGGFRVLSLSLLNREQKSVAIKIDLGQMAYDDDGNLWATEEITDSGRSCAPWIAIEPKNFVLPPNGRRNVRISLKVPEDAKGGYYTCAIINARTEKDTSETTLPSPTNCPIVLTIPTTFEIAGEIIKVDVEHPVETAVSLKAKFKNNGNVHTVLFGGVNLERWVEPGDVPGLVVIDTGRYESAGLFKFETDSTYILPGETRTIKSQIVSGLPAGKYRAQIAIMYGLEKPLRFEKEFEIGPKTKGN